MQRVIVDNREDGVTVISINRPERRNAICADTATDLQNALAAFDASHQRVAVLTSTSEQAFSAGADVSNVPEFWRCLPTIGVSTDKPLIAAVQGWCVGGGFMMTVMCDMVIAAENARFTYPEAKLGLTQGGMAALAARIPHKIAMEIMLRGSVVDAARAYEVSLVNEVVPVGRAVDRAIEIAAEMAEMAPLVLAMLKRSVVDHILPLGPTERAGRYRREAEVVARSEDCQEGFAAFKDKRKPVFLGR